MSEKMRTWESPPTRFSEYNTYDGGCLEMKREELGHKANMATSKKPIMLSNQSYGRSKTQNLNGWKIAPFSSCWQLLKVVLILVMIQTQLGHARASPISLSDLHGVEPVPAPWPTRATTYALLFLLFRATSFPNREIVIRRQRLRLASFVWFLAGLCSFVRNDVHGGGKELEWLTILLVILGFLIALIPPRNQPQGEPGDSGCQNCGNPECDGGCGSGPRYVTYAQPSLADFKILSSSGFEDQTD